MLGLLYDVNYDLCGSSGEDSLCSDFVLKKIMGRVLIDLIDVDVQTLRASGISAILGTTVVKSVLRPHLHQSNHQI